MKCKIRTKNNYEQSSIIAVVIKTLHLKPINLFINNIIILIEIS